MSQQTEQQITLTTGVTIPESLLSATLAALRGAFMNAPVAFHDLVQHCRTDGTYRIFGNGVDRLQSYGLLDPDGKVPRHVREIVVAAVEGEGFDMRIINPRRDIV